MTDKFETIVATKNISKCHRDEAGQLWKRQKVKTLTILWPESNLLLKKSDTVAGCIDSYDSALALE